jgi:hypothetical protein
MPAKARSIARWAFGSTVGSFKPHLVHLALGAKCCTLSVVLTSLNFTLINSTGCKHILIILSFILYLLLYVNTSTQTSTKQDYLIAA